MSSDVIDAFVKHLVIGLCRKFALQDNEPTVADKFSNELLEFSRHFQDFVLNKIYNIPAPLITSKDSFVVFLGSVCSDICNLEEDVEPKFFILCAFITNLMTLSFMLPCYRLIEDMHQALKFQLQMKLSLSFPSDARVAFQSLEGKILQLASNRRWIRIQIRELKRIIKKAIATYSRGLEKQPILANLLKMVNEHKSRNNEDSSVGEPCPFCESSCKGFLQSVLNSQATLYIMKDSE